ncbi:MAG: hypothetical protein SGJ18_08520 [Pseudomonadota bacterium]|nr:hypothetical protein [Pseudomonadota bacterium]
MKYRVLIAFPLFLSFSISYAERECELSNVGPLIAFHISQLKIKLIDYATEDFSSFCQWNRMDRFSQQFSSDVQRAYNEMKTKGDEKGAAQLLAEKTKERSQLDIWALSMAGHPAIKELANSASFLVTCTPTGFPTCKPASNKDLKAALSKSFQNNFLYTPDYQPIKDRKPSSSVLQFGACTLFSNSSASTCMGNLSHIESLMAVQSYVADQNFPRPVLYKELPATVSMGMGSKEMPFTSSMVTAAPIVKKILTDAAATEGLRRAALKMLERQNSALSSETNAFDDIKSSFEEAGLTSQEAENKTWDAMAALASGGPNFAKRWSREGIGNRMDLKNINDNPNAFALQVIAELLPKLDTEKSKQQKGALYSLPARVGFPCDIGKSYHFWMTAYLSRNLIKNGSDAEAARSAAYIANLGYQMNRQAFAGSELNMKNLGRFGATENGIRMDLILAAAGSLYGSNSAGGKATEIDLAEKYRQSMKSSSAESTYLGKAGSLFPGFGGNAITFIDRIQPNFIFDSVK